MVTIITYKFIKVAVNKMKLYYEPTIKKNNNFRYARISMEAGNYAEALRMMQISHKILERFPEGNEEQSAILLNDMATMYDKVILYKY